MSKELLSMNVCPYCKKIKGNTKLEFFDHMVICETMDHRNSPITTTWHTIEEMTKPKSITRQKVPIIISYIAFAAPGITYPPTYFLSLT